MGSKILRQGMFIPWEASKILKKNTLLMGRCIAHNVEMEAKIRVFRMMFDDNLNSVSKFQLLFSNGKCELMLRILLLL